MISFFWELVLCLGLATILIHGPKKIAKEPTCWERQAIFYTHLCLYLSYLIHCANIYIYNINICKLEQIEYSSFWTTFLFQWAIVRFDVAQFPVV